MMNKTSFSTPVLVVGLALVYFLAGKTGLTLALANPSATTVWPPTGIALAACLLLGYRVWPGILIGAFLVNVSTSGYVWASLAIAIGNTLEAVVGTYLINQFAGGSQVLNRARDIFKFTALAGMFSPTISATIGVFSLILNGLADWANYGPIWVEWWLGDVWGAIIVAPLLIAWAMHPRVTGERWVEASALALTVVFTGFVIFGGFSSVSIGNYPIGVIILPLIVWAAFRFGQRGATTTTFALSSAAIWGIIRGYGPFYRNNLNESLLLSQAFVSTIAITGLSVAALVDGRQRAEQALRAQRKLLQITLASIGDAVIATDIQGWVTFINPVAESLTGWPETEALARPLTEVFQIINAQTRQAVENPALRALHEGAPVGLANHTHLIARDGREIPIDDSGAPIKDETGRLMGIVLIFRDITEREAAEDALRQSRDQLTAILQGAADGILVQDRNGQLRYANEAATRMMGHTSVDELLGAALVEIQQKFEIHDESGQSFPVERLPGQLALQGVREASAIIRYRRVETGEEHWFFDKSAPIFDAQGRVEFAIIILHDITELKQTELAQRLLAEVGHLLAASLDAPTQLANLAQTVVPVFADWCAVDVISSEETIERVAVAHIDPAKVAFAQELQRRYPIDINASQGISLVLRTGQSQFYPYISSAALEAAAQNDEQRQLMRELQIHSVMIVPLVARGRILGALSLVWAESGRQYTRADLALAEELGRRAGLALDNVRLHEQAQQLNTELEQRVALRTAQLRSSNAQLQIEVTERQQAQLRLEESQHQLRQLSAHLQAAREEERTRIAREIHDELGQVLTALKMDIWSLRQAAEAGPLINPIANKLTTMLQMIDTTVQWVRRIATELRPSILDDLGLAAAIEWQLTEFQARSGIEYTLTTNLEESAISAANKTALFRILQEALTNITRHAQATQVTVSLIENREHVTLQVQDNGRGLSDSDITKSRSFGLLGIRERVHLLNGELQLQGVPGQGTTITVRLALEPATEIGGLE